MEITRSKLLAVACAVMILPACASRWSKPGGTESEFYADRFQCEQYANSTHPVHMVAFGSGYQGPAQTTCFAGAFGQMNCTTRPGVTIAPVPVDVNAGARGNEIQRCLISKGYTRR